MYICHNNLRTECRYSRYMELVDETVMSKGEDQVNVRRKATSWFAALLVATLIVGIFPMGGMVQAATETVTGIEFDSTASPLHVVVEGTSQQLKLYANIKEDGSKQDVTGKATWTSSNPKIAEVSDGWVKGISSGTVEITAKYSTYTVKKTVVSEYMYDKLVVKNAESGTEVGDTLNLQLGMKPTWKAYAVSKVKSDGDDITETATWASSDTAVADIDKGVVTLKSKGEAEITLKHKGMTKTIKIKVTMPYEEIKVASATSNNDKLIEFYYGGAEEALTVKAKKVDSEGKIIWDDVTEQAEWTSSDEKIVSVTGGKISKAKPNSVGTATLTATYLGRTDSITVVVRPSFQAMKMTPDKPMNKMIGEVVTLKVEIMIDAANEKDVSTQAEWTSSNVMTATVTNGVVQLKSEGTTTITATYQGLSKSIDVKVYPTVTGAEWAEKDPNHTDIALPRELNVSVDDVKDIPGVVGKTFAGDKLDISDLMTWNSNDTTIAKIEEGKIKAVSQGVVQLVGQFNGKDVLFLNVNVKRKVLVMQANMEDMTIVTGREAEFPKVSVIYTDGEEQDVTNEVKWESSSPNLLVRDDKLKGLIASKVSLKASYANVNLTFRVTIEEAVVQFVIEPKSVSLNVGKSESIKVTGKFKNGKTISLGSKIEWKVENEQIASIRSSSLKGLAIGSTKLVGEYQGTKLEVPVNVVPRLVKIEAEPNSLKLSVGQSAPWKVSAIYDTGDVVDVTSKVTAVPSNTKIKVSKGSVQAVSKGSGSIKFTIDGKSATLRVTVK